MNELIEKENKTWKYTGVSSDICFCLSDCEETDCHRNKKSEFYKKAVSENHLVSMANMSWDCGDYRSEKSERSL